MIPTLYALVLSFAAMVMIALVLVTSRWRYTRGYVYLSLMLGAIALWCVGGAWEVLASRLETKALLSAISYMGSQTCTVFFLLFVLQYTQQTRGVSSRRQLLLWIVPALTLGFVFTNDLHHLVWSDVRLHDNNPWGPAHYIRGPWFTVMVVYGYLVMGSALVFLWRAHARHKALHARQIQLMMLAALAPWLGHVLYILRIPLLHGYDASPLGFAISGPLLVYAAHRYGFMDMVPVARDTLIETMRDGLVVLDQQLRIADINPAACRLLGLPGPGQTIGQTLAEIDVLPSGLVEFCRQTRADSRSFTLEPPRGGGGSMVLEADLSILSVAGPDPGRLLTLRDISRRRQMEHALVENETRFRIAVEKTGQIVYEYDVPSGTIIWAGAIRDITGFSPEEFQSMDIHGWERQLHPEDVTLVMDRLARAIQQRRDFNAEYRFRRKDGHYVNIEDRASFVGPPGQPAHRMIGIMSDVTQSYSLKEQLHQSQKMEAIGRLAGGIAHDFNNLLMVIMNSADFVKESVEDRPDARGDLEEILHASHRASDLTRQLLLFSRKQPLKRKLTDIGECLVNVDKMLARIVGEDIRVEVDLESEMPPVLVDAGLIELAVMNVAVNARDAMPAGGALTLRACSSRIAENDYISMIEKPASRTGTYARVDIIDSGTGMSPEVLKRIFEPFFTTKGIGKGTGLGLSTAFGIVRQHEGFVAVASRPDRGSRFSFYLPFHTHAVPLAAAEQKVFAHYRGKTVLVAEDDPSVRRILLSMLAQLDMNILEAESGPDALAKVEAHRGPMDVLLTDVVMPGMDGYRLAALMLERIPGLRVAYISGYPRDHVGLPADDTNAPLLSKPFTRAELIRLLHQLFDPASSRTVDRG